MERIKLGLLAVVLIVAGSSPVYSRQEAAGELAEPTPQQAAWQDCEIGMFIHFAPNTWTDREYDDLSLPPERMNPEKLDTDQWVAAAEAMGAAYIVFVAKHIKRRFGQSLAETSGEGPIVELDLGRPTSIDHVITMEEIT
ncbi:MAG: hypothetical protein ABIK89_02815, partial [Planctomycetota bacterium]